MSKIKLTLKWRLTLFAMMIVAAASAILVFTINYDIKHTMPKLKNTIISAGDPSYIDGNQIYIEDGIFDEIDGDGNMIIAMAIEEATLKIYWFSIMIFALVLVAAGACIYFMVDRALIPVVELNKNIKKINE